MQFIRDRSAEHGGGITISDYLLSYNDMGDGLWLRLLERITADDPHNDFLKLHSVVQEYSDLPNRWGPGLPDRCVHIVGLDYVIGRSGGPPHLSWFVNPEDSKYHGRAELANVEIAEMAVRLFDAAFARKQYDWPIRIFLDEMGLIPPEERVYPVPGESEK
ncbi:MAG: hypothetical protein JJU33_02360 [Phycisphaerales bacterium]|nr:hypothetical protein [Phycisphaerales bacterium]